MGVLELIRAPILCDEDQPSVSGSWALFREK
jgi:hypothetical protein